METLARKCARWAVDHREALSRSTPESPEQLGDRSADYWEALFAVADVVGGEWPSRARSAALALEGIAKQDAEDDELSLQLLADIRELYEGEMLKDPISMRELSVELGSMEGRPWNDLGRGRPLNPHGLGKMLRTFDIVPRPHRVGVAHFKGYRTEQFEDAFRRYLPTDSVAPVTELKSLENIGNDNGSQWSYRKVTVRDTET